MGPLSKDNPDWFDLRCKGCSRATASFHPCIIRPRNGQIFQGAVFQLMNNTKPGCVSNRMFSKPSPGWYLSKHEAFGRGSYFPRDVWRVSTNNSTRYLIQQGLSKLLVVGGLVLFPRGREPRAQCFDLTGRLRLCNLDDMKTSVTRRIGRFV